MIELKDLQKVIGADTLIDIPELVVQEGEVAALLGAVDSGRDVLFRLLTGELRPTGGLVHVCGVDPVRDRATFSRRVGVLFPQNNLYRRLSALTNLQFYARLHCCSAAHSVGRR